MAAQSVQFIAHGGLRSDGYMYMLYVVSNGYGYGYEDCRGHPGARTMRYYAHSTLSGSTVGRYVRLRF